MKHETLRAIVIAALCAASVVEALGWMQQRRGGRGGPIEPSKPLNPAEVEQGEELYNTSCTMCHGLKGTVGDRGPALAANRRYRRATESAIFDAIKNGIAGTLMPASPLPETEVRKLVAYIRSLRATAIDVPVSGDIAAGAVIFEGKGRCRNCHMLNGRGGLTGPDLSNIGAERSLRSIQDALTMPKDHIPRGYQPVTLTAEGKRLRGVLKNESNFSFQLLDTDGKLHLLTRDEVRDLEYDKQSLMPSDYDKQLTPVEFRDLLAFVSRQARDRETK